MRRLTLTNSAFDHGSIKTQVIASNEEVRLAVGRRFRQFSRASTKLCLCAVGSDGRLEKGAMSPLELILYHKDIGPSKIQELALLANSLPEPEAPQITDGKIDVKSVQRDEINYAFDDHRRPYPSRVLDSYPVYGNSDILNMAKLRMLGEWNTPAGKKIVKAIKERRKEARRVMLSGRQRWKGQDVYHFNLECGRAFYGNEDGLQIRSVKPGPLRFVQSVIEVGMVVLGRKLEREGKHLRMVEILNGMPTPTIDKLRYLERAGVVSLDASDIEKICDSYLSFLKIYRASESAFSDGENIVSFDGQEARERIELLTALLEKPLVRE